MGSHRSADRHCHHRTNSGVPELRFAATSAGRHRLRHRIDLSAISRSQCRSIRRCSPFMETRREHLSQFLAARSTRMEARRRIRKRWKRLRQSPERLPFERRSRTSSDRTNRLQHQRKEHHLVSVPGRHRACRPPTPTLSIPYSIRFLRSRLYSFAAGYTHVFSPNLGELFQSGVFLVRKPFRSRRFPEDAGGFSDRFTRQRRERAVHYPRRTRQHMGSGETRLPVLHQRQSGMESRRARVALWHQHPNPSAE